MGKSFLQDIITTWKVSVPTRSAAALAFRGIFAVAPILFIAMTMVSIFFGAETARKEIDVLLESTVGQGAAELIKTQIEFSSKQIVSGRTLASLVGVGVLLYASLLLFKELKTALNTVWGLPPLAGQNVFALVKHQLIALVLLLSIGIFLVSLLIIALIVAVLEAYILGGETIAIRIIGNVAMFGMFVMLIAVLYKFLPAVDVTWTDVFPGAIVTTLLMLLGIWGIRLYLGLSNIGSTFGSGEVVIVLLLWIYYTAQVFLFGAVFSKAYAINFGSMKSRQDSQT